MEMNQVRYALAAAETLNFTRAAESCDVSQPALTKAIKALEAELGGPLFHREGKRVLMTEFGRSILPHLKEIQERTRLAQAVAADFRLLNKAPVRLGVLSTVGHVRFARFLAQLHSVYEGLEISVEEGGLAELKRRLQDGELDLAVLNPLDGVGDAFTLLPLYTERYVVILPPGHRLAAANGLRLSDLSGEAYVDRLACEMREMVMEVCRGCGVELYARFRSEREDWVQAMVLARIGFAFMPEFAVTHPELTQRPLVEPEVGRTIALASAPGRPYSPGVAALVRTARTYAWPG